jgi:chromosome partitioning protein
LTRRVIGGVAKLLEKIEFLKNAKWNLIWKLEVQMEIALREISGIVGMTPQGIGKAFKGSDETSIKSNRRFYSPRVAREVFESRGFVYPQQNFIWHCLKGGAGKSELSRNFAFRAAQLGTRVLYVDLDKQANSSRSFGVENPEWVFVDVITGKCKVEDAILKTDDFLHVLPSNFRNARIEAELISRQKNPQTFFSKMFEAVRGNYDCTVFDLAPDLNNLSFLASLYATTAVVPANSDRFSVDGAAMTIQSLQGLREQYPDLEQEVAIVLNKYDSRERASFKLITELQQIEAATLLPVVVRTDATFKNAHALRQTVFEFSRKSNAREDIDLLTQELLGLREFFGPKATA